MQLIERITAHAMKHPTRKALVGLREQESDSFTSVDSAAGLSYEQLVHALDTLAAGLRRQSIEVLGLFADNGPAWLLVDLACQKAGVTLVPLPGFFTAQQLEHTIRASGMRALLTDDGERFVALHAVGEAKGELGGLTLIDIPAANSVTLPAETAKVTFTSGSTGTPRGVCLANDTQYATAAALAQALAELGCTRHLCLLPLATLLENVAGAYTGWLLEGTVIAPSLAELGFRGSSQLDPVQLCRCIDECQPDSLILLPQILKLLVAQIHQRLWQAPASLRFVAVGGGKVSPELLCQARALGLPVFEGYGLSECGSVVALNLPGADRPGAAGRPLPHCEIRVRDGEVQVRGPRYLGYLGDSDAGSDRDGGWLRTGDLGAIDDNGFLQITGRRKNLLISAFGRNISPEWVESELLLDPQLLQCVVIGDARPHCCALVFPHPGIADAQVDRWIQAVNERLPDYAQIRNWARLPAPLSFDDGLLTANGRPRRDAISHRYAESIETLYGESHAVL